MTLTTERLRGLVERDDPVEVVWEALWDIWESPDGPDEQYDRHREWEAVELERTLLDTCWELYREVLPWRCVNETSMEVPDDGAFLVMDAMSVREAGLFVEILDDQGYDVSVDYSYATVPSETADYKERVGYADRKRDHASTTVRSRSPSLSGKERLVWCKYPDSLFENVQEGKTELSTFEESYRDTEEAFCSILEQLEADRVIVGSDHGYIRGESGFNFAIGEQEKNRLKETFGGSRFVRIDETEGDGDALVENRLAVEADGYYLPVGRYTWPVRGKYSTVQHGGLSLMECLTPRLEIQR